MYFLNQKAIIRVLSSGDIGGPRKKIPMRLYIEINVLRNAVMITPAENRITGSATIINFQPKS